MNPRRLVALLAVALASAVPSPAMAYIGPGTGLGAIAITIAFLLGVFLLLVGLVWYPLKRLLKERRGGAPDSKETDKSE